MATEPTPNVPVQAVEKTLEILQGLQELDGAGTTELADHLGMAKSTVFNHLRTLETHRYVVRDGDTYRIGLRFLTHGCQARDRNTNYRIVRPKVREIAEQTGEICQFVVEEGGRGIVVFHERGDRAVETRTRVGSSFPLHAITGGKAILAELPDEQVAEIIASTGLPPATERTVTDESALRERLADVRDRGYAVNREEHIKGLRAISVPITTTEGDLLGALVVSGPSYRLEEQSTEEELANVLLGVANELELNVTYSRF